VAGKSSGVISAEPVRGQKIEVGTDLDLAYVTMTIDLV